jgi:hypothetical protein
MCANAEQIGYFQQRVARGEYKVNSQRVAAAMLQRIGAMALLDRDLNVGDDRGRRGDNCPPPRHA